MILRFHPPRPTFWQRLIGTGLPRFQAGDLVGIIPSGSDLPRFYSIASASKDGFLEICVRKHTGGLCSTQLSNLQPGQSVEGVIRANPMFRPYTGDHPVILIAAGTGIGPLAGFVRANDRRRPMHLYFGIRHPGSDLLYGEELVGWKKNGHILSISAAFSRAPQPTYVQDILRRDAMYIAELIASGGQILVCGGREMAAGVATALTDILIPHGVSLATLKADGRYAEDVY
jgi:sulfite reductase (NADPH) flavoprotein alpha-component